MLLKDIAQREGISLLYLEHLVAPLIKGGIIKSTRGPRGGVSLLKQPGEVKLSEAIQLLEGLIAPVGCVNNPGAYPRSELCAIRDIWVEMRRATFAVLESTTLQDLAERQREKWNLKPRQGKEHHRVGSYAGLNNQRRDENGLA